MDKSFTFSANNDIQYDKYDVDYTTHLKHLFNVCNQETKEEVKTEN